jgi:hypothetical protein
MDVPPKFALPLLLVAALPAGFAVLRNPPAASSSATPVTIGAARVGAPEARGNQNKAAVARDQEDAAVARQADEAIAIGRVRRAAAEAERARSDSDLALIRDQKTVADTFHAVGDDGTADRPFPHDLTRQRLNAQVSRMTYCARSRWHCE